MTAFVILAAGRGTRIGRVGESLHKALVPLDQQAIITHLLRKMPENAYPIICLGHRGQQIRDYVRLAHPGLKVQFVEVDGWDEPGGGPGHSLLAAMDCMALGDDMMFTSCDTLWGNTYLPTGDIINSWAAVAPIPSGTPPTRWCRIERRGDIAVDIHDKTPDGGGDAYTGLGYIHESDMLDFYRGVKEGNLQQGERQVSGGFAALIANQGLRVLDLDWMDVGDEAAYRQAVIETSGYDWTKLDEATYVLPRSGRVVKFWADESIPIARVERSNRISNAVPPALDSAPGMLAYPYVVGLTIYEALEKIADGRDLIPQLADWAHLMLWRPLPNDEWPNPDVQHALCSSFYGNKTIRRVNQLRSPLRERAMDAVSRVDWSDLALGMLPSEVHGDFNFGNILVQYVPSGPTLIPKFTGIDWRQDWAGKPWGDKRYDIAKLLAGCEINWDRAKRGDMRPWDRADSIGSLVRHYFGVTRDIEIIAALSLLNSAPLHDAPLDEMLVTHGTRWLERIL